MISEIFDRVVENSISAYHPEVNLTIDEQLLPSKARCPFLQYMPNKPDKFGMKFSVLCDTDSKYVLKIMPYLGKNDDRPDQEGLGTYVTKNYLSPIITQVLTLPVITFLHVRH